MPTVERRPGNVIEVFPGKHAFSKALAKAHPGDMLNIHAGTYKDSLVVRSPGPTSRPPATGGEVDGRCTTEATIAVRADDLMIEGITVVGGMFYEHGLPVRGERDVGVEP